MAISVDVLPNELWRKILGYATDCDSPTDRLHLFQEHMLPPTGKKSMRAKLDLSYVSKFFRSISAEFLYEAVVITGGRRPSHESQFL